MKMKEAAEEYDFELCEELAGNMMQEIPAIRRVI